MRVLFYVPALAAFAACNPYNPDLGPTPFRCGAMDPQCPGGYECVAGLCEEMGGDSPDADTHPDSACADLAEPNSTITTPTPSPVWVEAPSIQYEGLTLCPAMDADYFSMNQPLNCGPSGPACPNVSALVEFEDLNVPPTVSILNATGTVVAPGGSTGNQGEVKARLGNVAQGIYYVRVTDGAILNHYRLTIDGNSI